MRPEEIVDRYLKAVTERSLRAGGDRDPDYTFREWPNAINPRAASGPRDARAGLEHARTLLAEHSFDVHEHLVHGDTVVSRMTWRGTLAATGRSSPPTSPSTPRPRRPDPAHGELRLLRAVAPGR